MVARRTAFTLIELLVVIAIIAILAVVVVLVLNPAQLLAQSRDANRISDMSTLNSAINLYTVDLGGASGSSLGNASSVYISVTDSSSTCGNLGLPILLSGYGYGCSSSTSSRNANSTGWIPIDFTKISAGSPFGSLPQDPVNQTSSNLYYAYYTQNGQFEFSSFIESQKYAKNMAASGGTDIALYEVGSGASTLPELGRGYAGYWPMDEGNGSTAFDVSGSGNSGSWYGNASGTSGHYSAGKVGSWAGYFDGTTNYIAASSSNILNVGASDFAVAFWFKNNVALGANFWNIVGKKNVLNGTDIGWMFWFRSAGGGGHGLNMRFNNGSLNDTEAGSNTDVSAQIADGNWHFVVASVSRSRNTVDFYFDNTNVGFTGVAPSGNYSNAEPLGIGATGIGNQKVPAGFLLDDVRIYNRAISSAEAQTLYNAGK